MKCLMPKESANASIQSVPTAAQSATSVPVTSGSAAFGRRGRAYARVFRPEAASASAAATSGTHAITIIVRSIPMRSASMPVNGTLSPLMPHAKPIISDDTVAALIGASDLTEGHVHRQGGLQQKPAERDHDNKGTARTARRQRTGTALRRPATARSRAAGQTGRRAARRRSRRRRRP